MQFKSVIASLALLAVVVTALPNNPVTVTVTETQTDTQTVAAPTQTTVSQCDNGDQVCCNTVDSASSLASLLSSLGILDNDLTGIIGIGCIDILGSDCTEQAACCTGVAQNGLVNIGCSPINL